MIRFEESNVRGSFAYAMTGPDTRTTQLYINLKDNTHLDAQGFAPLGRVVEGMEIVDGLYAGYDEDAGGGMRGGKQGEIFSGGNAHLDRAFPIVDKTRASHDRVEEKQACGFRSPVSVLPEIAALLALIAVAQPLIGADYPIPQEGDYRIENFEFASGEVLPELNLHYTTIGEPRRDASGTVRNAVLIMHGTTGSGGGFLSERFAGELFGPGQLLDGERYYLILPDAIGHGKSSRPSDGLHMSFPKYTYDDMVRAQYRLVTEHLGVDHLRLVMGTSMGGMHTWVWGYTYPGLHGCPHAPGQSPGRDRRPQPDAAQDDHRLRSRPTRRGTAASTSSSLQV